MTRNEARRMWEYYNSLVEKYLDAQEKLVKESVKSYKVGDLELTRFDLGTIDKLLDKAIAKRDEYAAIMNSGNARKCVGVIPRDL